MSYHFAYDCYFISLIFASICAIYRFRIVDTASRILAILVCCGFLNEATAYYLSKHYRNNLPLYAIYCFIEFGILCLYFDNVIDVFVKRRIGRYIAIFGIILGILNLIFIQNLNSLDSYFLFLEDLTVVGMSLFAFFRLLLMHDSLHFTRYHHFWFLCILVFFWSITFLNWGLYDYINIKFPAVAWKMNFALPFVGVITYFSFGIVYLLYPKMQKSNER